MGKSILRLTIHQHFCFWFIEALKIYPFVCVCVCVHVSQVSSSPLFASDWGHVGCCSDHGSVIHHDLLLQWLSAFGARPHRGVPTAGTHTNTHLQQTSPMSAVWKQSLADFSWLRRWHVINLKLGKPQLHGDTSSLWPYYAFKMSTLMCMMTSTVRKYQYIWASQYFFCDTVLILIVLIFNSLHAKFILFVVFNPSLTAR